MNGFKLFLTEVSKKVIDSLSDVFGNVKPESLPFSNIFGNKTRLTIPFITPELKQLEKELNDLGYQVDFSAGTASRTIKTRRGNKQVKIKIGKILESQKGKEWDYWKTYWNKFGGGFSIIVSRHPMDILRMADFKNMKSCHSETGTYFGCAKEEARDGGLVAFLVKTNDVKDIDLSDNEIFADEKRDVKGIVPSARIRLRRFDGPNMSLAIPETRVYGTSIDGFKETIMDWARKVQPVAMRPSMNDFKLVGGWYQDTIASALFNNFFQDHLDKGSIGGDMSEQMNNEMRAIERNNHFDFPAEIEWEEHSVDEEGMPQFEWGVRIPFRIEASKMPTTQKEQYALTEKIKSLLKRDMSTNFHQNFRGVYLRKPVNNVLNFFVSLEGFGGPDDFREMLENTNSEFSDYHRKMYYIKNILLESGYLEFDRLDKLRELIFDNKLNVFDLYSEENDVPVVFGYIKLYMIPETSQKVVDEAIAKYIRHKDAMPAVMYDFRHNRIMITFVLKEDALLRKKLINLLYIDRNESNIYKEIKSLTMPKT